MTIFVERTEDGLQNQLDNFLNKAPNYPALGLNATKLTELRKDWTLMRWVLTTTNAINTNAVALTAYKTVLRKGGDLGVIPPIPVIVAAPPVTSGGMEARFRAIIQDAVRSSAMTDAIAKDLGIVAPATSGRADTDAAKPQYKLAYSSGGYPNIIWKKGNFEGVEIHKSKDGIAFSKLDRDFKPDYTDKSDLPEPTKAEVWYYKLIYLLNDEQVGQWSDVQSITVGG